MIVNTAILIQQAMAKDPAQRPQTAVILAHDLDRIAAGIPISGSQIAQEETVIEPYYAAAAVRNGDRSNPIHYPFALPYTTHRFEQYLCPIYLRRLW